MFIGVLAIVVILNIWGGTIMDKINNVSVWWHVAGASIVVIILVVLPESHMSFNDVFSMRVNNSGGLHGGGTDGSRPPDGAFAG
jgi:amino acid transporter